MAFNQFPYSNFHDLNLDWILDQVKNLKTAFSDFRATNTVTAADPIIWNIGNAYPKATMVSDGQTIYISIQPVPAGIALTNTAYWQKVLDLNYTLPMPDPISGKKFLIVGDSISDENINWSTTTNVVWATFFKNYVEQHGGTVVNLAQSGAGFTKTNSLRNTIYKQLQSVTLSNYDSIIVFGGINDVGLEIGNINTTTTGTLTAGLLNCSNLLSSFALTGNVYVITPCKTSLKASTGAVNNTEFTRNVVANWASRNGFIVIDSGEFNGFDYGSQKFETVHIKNEYAEEFANYVIRAIWAGGAAYIPTTTEHYFTPEVTNGTVSSASVILYNNGHLMYQMTGTASGGNVTITVPFSPAHPFYSVQVVGSTGYSTLLNGNTVTIGCASNTGAFRVLLDFWAWNIAPNSIYFPVSGG